MPTKEWTMEDLLGLSWGAYRARLFLTAAELDLFTALSMGSMSAGALAESKGCDKRGMRVLLDALTALGLLKKDGDLYRTHPELSSWLRSDSDDSILPMARHAGVMWDRWSRLTEVVKTGKPAALNQTIEEREASFESFILAMHVVGRDRAAEMIGTINLKGVGRVLDVGGASGSYTLEFLKAKPDIRVTLFDLPAAVLLAEKRMIEEGVADRVDLYPGDFAIDELPKGHDLAWVSAIIHMNSREENRDLYGKVYASLSKGGRVVIRDHVMDRTKTKPDFGAVFAVNMLVATEGGGCYTFDEIQEDLEASGFDEVRLLRPDARMDGIVEARKIS